MKKAVSAIFICLIFILSGCVEIEIRNPNEYEPSASPDNSSFNVTGFSEHRNFALSDEAAFAAISLADDGAVKAEICAYYENIVTYKVSYNDGSAEFYNFKILSENGFSLEFISKRATDGTLCGFSDLCEFYPTAADGYPEKALTPVYYWELADIGIEKCESPEKVFYNITTLGSGMAFTEKEHIEKICGAVEQLKILLVERFFTDYEENLYIELEANTFEYFANVDDENPLYTVYIELFRIDSSGEKGRMYYVFDDSAFGGNFNKVYHEILDEKTD